jgi:ADP-heptose:LPS heptosyltransferase
MPERRFLIVRLGSLGDIVHTFPAVAGLRETFPKSEIIWLTDPRWKFLVESSGLASEVWTTATRSFASVRDAIHRVRHTKWDAAVDYQGLWKSAALPFWGGVKRRIGFSSETIREFGVPLLYTDRVKATAKHIADQNGELSLRAGARKGVGCFTLSVPAEDEGAADAFLLRSGAERYVVLSPGGGWRSKCWPPERFGALCREVRESLGLRCVLNYGPGEEHLVAAVRAGSGNSDPLLHNAGLGELMAVLRHASCVVGGDTGPLHLAAGLGTPVVALFGPTDPARNGPYRTADCRAASGGVERSLSKVTRDIVLRSAAARTSHKRGDQPDRSMLDIELDSVFEAVRSCIGTTA